MAPDLPPADATRMVKAIDAALAQRETTAQRAAAEQLVAAYAGLDADGRKRFLRAVATEFGADPAVITRAVDHFRVARDGHRPPRSRA